MWRAMPRRCHSGATPTDRISASSAAIWPMTKPASVLGSRTWATNAAAAGCSIKLRDALGVPRRIEEARVQSRDVLGPIRARPQQAQVLGIERSVRRVPHCWALAIDLSVLRLGVGRAQIERLTAALRRARGRRPAPPRPSRRAADRQAAPSPGGPHALRPRRRRRRPSRRQGASRRCRVARPPRSAAAAAATLIGFR